MTNFNLSAMGGAVYSSKILCFSKTMFLKKLLNSHYSFYLWLPCTAWRKVVSTCSP